MSKVLSLESQRGDSGSPIPDAVELALTLTLFPRRGNRRCPFPGFTNVTRSGDWCHPMKHALPEKEGGLPRLCRQR